MNSNDIIGVWYLDPSDIASRNEYGDVAIEFKPGGEMIYTIFVDDKTQKIFMTYEIKEDLIISDQPSAPNQQETPFRILPDKRLMLAFGGMQSFYIKQ